MNRPITSRMHGTLDYPAGILLVAAPWIFGFSDVGGAAVTIPVVLGVLVLLQSLVTDYELSVANLLPLPAHLGLDVAAGVLLAVSPFVFGLGLIGSGLMTQRHRQTPRQGAAARPSRVA